MRVDKYLWCIRVFKSRSLAANQCKAGKVLVGEEWVKASRELKIGEVVTVRKGNIHFSYKVIEFPRSRVGAKFVPEYMKDVTTKEELDKLEMMKLTARMDRPKGLGRPTKRERRAINRFKDGDDRS